MSLSQRMDDELKAAMKARDQVRMDTLRMLKSDVKRVEIDKKAPLTDEEILSIVQKSIKKRQDSIEMFKTGGRQDLVDKESGEIEILKVYLPEQMDEAQITVLAKEAIAATGAASKKDTGKVMGALMPKVKGKADGRLVQQVVSGLLP